MDYLDASAAISEDGLYRFELHRKWHETNPQMCVIMLNPSTADGEKDDRTIARCVGFARGFGCGELIVVNLYALRSTKPVHLWESADPVGPHNDDFIREAVVHSAVTVAAWGTNAKPERVAQVLEVAGGEQLWSWGVNNDGSPKHPLYLPGVSALDRWPAA